MLSPDKLTLVDELMRCWSGWDTHEGFYINDLAPRIVRSSEFGWLAASERRAVSALRQALSSEEWKRLPEAIAWQRNEHHRIAEERVRREEEAERARDDERARQRGAAALRSQLEKLCHSDFLTVRARAAQHPELLTSDEVDQLCTEFVKSWFDRNGTPDDLRLDLEQARAVSADGDVQLVARAGSGKTRTITARALFLIDHCGVRPGEILLLAFNRDAADVMRKRLHHSLGSRLLHIMTFHALAYAIVHPEEDLLFDDAATNSLGLSREIQEVIDDHLRAAESNDLIRRVMLAHFRSDWDRIDREQLHLSRDDFLEFRRALSRETLNGEQVKSYGEKLIANVLFEHAVPYKYERNYRWDGQNYRPDFTIFLDSKAGIILEYFGLAGDPDYDVMSEEKRRFWGERDRWTLVECTPDEVAQGPDRFAAALVGRLNQLGVTSRRRTEDEIWHLVRRRAVDRFTAAVKGYVSRARKRSLSVPELRQLVVRHETANESERLFLEVGTSVYEGYLDRIAAQGHEDFDGLLARAAEQVRAGGTRFVRSRGKEGGNLARLRYLMVDEFQDLSQQFFDLLEAIRRQNPRAEFFGVGDDFQAINSFAGADLRYFHDFGTHFPAGTRLWLRNNYRSSRAIVAFSNRLMHGLGEHAVPQTADPGRVELAWLDNFEPTAAEFDRHPGDDITPAVLRVAVDRLEAGLNVAILSRTNYVPWFVAYDDRETQPRGIRAFLEHIRSFLPEEWKDQVDASTVHSYKGKEAASIVVLDALEGRYPLIHPNWIFTRIFGDSIQAIEDEERRLFYVALTRAKSDLYVIADRSRPSPFLAEISGLATDLNLGQLKVPTLGRASRLEIRAYDAFEVKDFLKALGFRFHGVGKYWARSVLAIEFDADALVKADWVARVRRVEVVDDQGNVILLAPTK